MSVAASSTAITQLGSAGKRSIGDINMEIQDIGIVSGDTSATSTAASLSKVDYAILIADVRQTAVATYSGTVATFSFADPVATVKGTVILLGK